VGCGECHNDGMNRLTPVTLTLIAANVLIYVVQASTNHWPDQYFALYPLGHGFQPWQLVTYGFLHGYGLHLAFNMFGLYMFGPEIELLLGRSRFIVYYFLCVVGAGLMQMIVTQIGHLPPVPIVGASGALFGLLLAFGMAYPKRKVMLIFLPIPMPAWFFVTAYGLLELYMGITGTQEGVAHFAHLGGMATGFVAIRYWKARGIWR
jgi:membrane associated rhomboid family serine protease